MYLQLANVLFQLIRRTGISRTIKHRVYIMFLHTCIWNPLTVTLGSVLIGSLQLKASDALTRRSQVFVLRASSRPTPVTEPVAASCV